MLIVRSIVLFVLAAIAEIGGAWLVWQGVREHRGLLRVGAGVIALGLYGFVAKRQADATFGRILAAYGGLFVAGSLAWGMVVDGFRPDRCGVIGAEGRERRRRRAQCKLGACRSRAGAPLGPRSPTTASRRAPRKIRAAPTEAVAREEG